MTGQGGYWLEEVPPKGQKQGSERQKTDPLKTAQGWEKSWQASRAPGQTARPSPCLRAWGQSGSQDHQTGGHHKVRGVPSKEEDLISFRGQEGPLRSLQAEMGE